MGILGIALATYFLRQAMLKNVTGRKKRSLFEEYVNPGQIPKGKIKTFIIFVRKVNFVSCIFFAYLKKHFWLN